MHLRSLTTSWSSRLPSLRVFIIRSFTDDHRTRENESGTKKRTKKDSQCDMTYKNTSELPTGNQTLLLHYDDIILDARV